MTPILSGWAIGKVEITGLLVIMTGGLMHAVSFVS
jgi:hypothetical protein